MLSLPPTSRPTQEPSAMWLLATSRGQSSETSWAMLSQPEGDLLQLAPRGPKEQVASRGQCLA